MSGRMRVWQWAAIVLGGCCLLVTLAWKAYAPPEGAVWGPYVWTLATVLPLYILAVWLIRLRPEHPQAQRLLLVALGSTMGVAIESGVRWAYVGGPAPDWLWAANFAHQQTGALGAAAGGALLAFYPDGGIEGPWHRFLVRLIWAQLAVPPLLHLTQPQVTPSPYLFEMDETAPDRVVSPIAIAALAPLGEALEALRIGYLGWLLGCVVLLARFVQADSEQRRRMRLLVTTLLLAVPVVVGIVVMVALGVPSDSPWYMVLGSMYIPLAAMIPISIMIGVLRHRLFDIEVAVRRSFVYGVLAVGIALLYVALAAAPGLALGGRVPVELAVVLTVLVALLIHPARRRLEAWADRWVFGERVNRYQLLASFGSGLEQTVDLRELLPRLADTVRRGLQADWVRVSLRGDDEGSWLAGPLGTSGAPEGDPVLVEDLRHDGELVGRLECGPHEGGYDDADRELVETLGRQAATAIANVRLAARLREQVAELAGSRARIVAAQDDERRRIERDIHDGVQQQVVALIAKLRLARNRLDRGEQPVDLLAEVQSDAGELLVDLRELAHGIHPPVLSDGGLLAAVEARAARLPMSVTVEADVALRGRRWDADVEAAAYFVVCEALTNVVKHARAQETLIRLAVDGRLLSVMVRDDGNGSAVNGHGHGLTNLRDRVEALGGQLQVDSRAGVGTSVAARLPIEVAHG